MPIFIFNKLIRDKLKEEYRKLDHRAVYKKLSKVELFEALKQKIIEEVNEIPGDGPIEEIVAELADVQQVVDDIVKHAGVTNEQIAKVKRAKFDKKGGFEKGLFVEQVTLHDDDEWVNYYRKSPQKYPEILIDGVPDDQRVIPLIEAGIYEHYKGKRYEVIGVGLDSETTKPVVVYIPLYETNVSFWVRPYELFLQFVDVDGKKVERFKKIND